MCFASFNKFPSIPLLLIRSDPAKSTKCSFDTKDTSDPRSHPSIVIVKIACDLDEHSLIGVELTCN